MAETKVKSLFFDWLDSRKISPQKAQITWNYIESACEYQVIKGHKNSLIAVARLPKYPAFLAGKLLADEEFLLRFADNEAAIYEALQLFCEFSDDLANGFLPHTPKVSPIKATPASQLSVPQKKTSFRPKNQKVYQRLKKRILSSFDKKFLIGDIPVNDEEYGELCFYAQMRVKGGRTLSDPLSDDPILSVAMVQVAIRTYGQSRKFWPHIAEAFNIVDEQIARGFLGQSFINTLNAHGKPVKDGYVSSVLAQTFVTNYYSKGLFELLFQYFDKDLERDINRNTTEQMQLLMTTLIDRAKLSEEENEKLSTVFGPVKSQAYKLRRHTLAAISDNPIHCRTRLRRYIRMIDRYFWSGYLPKEPVARLSQQFKQWAMDSDALQRQFRLREQGILRSRGKKHFSSPYLHVDLKSNDFVLVLPPQLLPPTAAEGATWNIRLGDGKEKEFPCETYLVVSGKKSEKMSIPLPENNLFDKMQLTLHCGESVSRPFRISAEDVRFFDEDGDYTAKIEVGAQYAFTPEQLILKSSGCLDKDKLGAISRWDFDFVLGDYVIYPSGDSRIVGDRYHEGLTERGQVNGVACIDADGSRCSVYGAAPSLVLMIEQRQITGSVLSVNGVRYSLRDCETLLYESKDARGTPACRIDLGQFPDIRKNNWNSILLSLPGNNFAKDFSFAYFPDLNINFEGAPNVFETHGTVELSGSTAFVPDSGINLEKAAPNTYNFELKDVPEEITFSPDGSTLTLAVWVPAFRWSSDRENWQLSSMGDIWHTDFPRTLYIKAPFERISLTIDADLDEESEDESTTLDFVKSQSGEFVCDLTRCQSWITRDKMVYTLELRAQKQRYTFGRIFSKSAAINAELRADLEQDSMVFHCDVIGFAEYYLDLVYLRTGDILLDKEILTLQPDQHFPIFPHSGKYKVTLYEADRDDDDLFDEPDYYKLWENEITLTNPDDLSGKYINLRYISRHHNGVDRLFLNSARWVKILEKIGAGLYKGILIEYGKSESDYSHSVEIVFADLKEPDRFFLRWYDAEYDEYLDFYYDNKKYQLVTDNEVDEQLTSTQKYRRYLMVYDDECIFQGNLADEMTETTDLRINMRQTYHCF